MMKIEKNGIPINTISDWKKHAPPKHENHWVEGRSAFELARDWCGTGRPLFPDSLRNLLETSRVTRGFIPEVCFPEHRIKFDDFGGEPRNADLAIIGAIDSRKVAITVEAKSDEPFGDTVSKTFEKAVERFIKNPSESKGVDRIMALGQAFMRPKNKGEKLYGSLMYQLFTAVAGTIAFGIDTNASISVLIINEYITDMTNDSKISRNGQDYLRFLHRLGNDMDSDLSADQIIGPIQIPGEPLFPRNSEFYIGKIQTVSRSSGT